MVIILVSMAIDNDIYSLRAQILRPVMDLMNHEKIDSAKLELQCIWNIFRPLPVIVAADDIDRRVGFKRVKNLRL